MGDSVIHGLNEAVAYLSVTVCVTPVEGLGEIKPLVHCCTTTPRAEGSYAKGQSLASPEMAHIHSPKVEFGCMRPIVSKGAFDAGHFYSY